VSLGGSIALFNSTVTIDDCKFSNNSLETRDKNIIPSGGAICIAGDHGSTLITNSLFSNNYVGTSESGYGGAISLLTGGANAAVTVVNSTFDQNLGFIGGSISVSTGRTLRIADSKFHTSTAQYGGALFTSDNTTLVIFNTTFSNCEAGVSGGAVLVSNSTSTTMTQVIAIIVYASDGLRVYA
jgi:hypothetical protein